MLFWFCIVGIFLTAIFSLLSASKEREADAHRSLLKLMEEMEAKGKANGA
jgi:hypothetical protein